MTNYQIFIIFARLFIINHWIDIFGNITPFYWSKQYFFSDCNWTRTHNYLVRTWTLNHLAKLVSLVKWLSVRLRTKWLWVRVQLQTWFILSINLFVLLNNFMISGVCNLTLYPFFILNTSLLLFLDVNMNRRIRG